LFKQLLQQDQMTIAAVCCILRSYTGLRLSRFGQSAEHGDRTKHRGRDI